MEEKSKEQPPPLGPIPPACMERRRGEDQVKPLLLKLAIPLSLSFAALVFSIIRRTGRRQSGSRSEFSSSEGSLMDSEDSISIFDLEEVEEQEEEATSSEMIMSELNLKITRVECPEVPAEAEITNFQEEHKLEEGIEDVKQSEEEGHNLEEEIEGLRSHLSEIESQFQGFCDAKEQESLFQKLQIMCLGFKLECLEAKNQRLQDAIFIRRGAASEKRAEFRILERKIEKLSRFDRAHLLHDRRRDSALNSQELELLRLDGEFKQVKDFSAQLNEKYDSLAAKLDSVSKRKEEMIEDHNTRMLSSNELLDQLELFRSQWYQVMEEFIYLGWVGASLSQELCSLPQEQEEPDQAHETLSAEFDVNDSERPSPSAVELGGDGDDVGARRKRRHSGLRRPRLLHKLKGWAKRKGEEKRKPHAQERGRW